MAAQPSAQVLYHALVLPGRAQRARQTARDVHIVRLQRKERRVVFYRVRQIAAAFQLL
jgi:hypothetical protein